MANTNKINLADLERIAREQGLPALDNQISKEPSPLLEKIGKPALTSSKIDVITTVGINGGFGFIAKNKNIPENGECFCLDVVEMCDTIEISNKDLILGVGDKGVDLLLNEMQSFKDLAVWNVGRSLFGNGKGVLCNVSALSSAGNTITVDSVKHLKEGMKVDFYAANAEVGSTPAHTGKRILGIDRKNKKITIDGAAITVSAGFITVQGSYGREIFGLGAFFDSSITSIYGVTKSGNNWLVPEEYDATGGITDTLISKAVREAQNYRNSKIDMILCGDTAYDAYVNYMKESKTQITDTQEFWGGVSGLNIVANGRKVVLVHEQHVADNEMIGVDTTKLKFYKTQMDFISKDSGIFERVSHSSVFQAVLGFYGNLFCENPGGLFKINNVG
ncbi:MAG: phage major capsid protein [Eubacteriales bacterium]|jgi:hypothetical protein